MPFVVGHGQGALGMGLELGLVVLEMAVEQEPVLLPEIEPEWVTELQALVSGF